MSTVEQASSGAAILERMREVGAVAVVRLESAARAERASEAVHAGGVSAIEVTLTTPGAEGVIRRLSARGDGMLVGAGSVLDADAARRALDAGARYLVCPALLPELVEHGHAAGAAVLLGAFTPTEALAAYRAGADAVKIFPAEALGPGYLKALRGPMPFLPLVPTGGVTPENAGEWIRAGALAVGLGGSLVDARLAAAGEWAEMTRRAERTVASVAAARAGGAQ